MDNDRIRKYIMSATNRLASLYYDLLLVQIRVLTIFRISYYNVLLRTADFQIRYLMCISSYTENIKPVSVLYSYSVTVSPRGMQCPGLL